MSSKSNNSFHLFSKFQTGGDAISGAGGGFSGVQVNIGVSTRDIRYEMILLTFPGKKWFLVKTLAKLDSGQLVTYSLHTI